MAQNSKDAQNLTNLANRKTATAAANKTSSKQKYKKRIPMEEKRILCNIINKFSLLLYCQCSSTLSSTTVSFFHLGISSIYRIFSYNIISYCQLKCRSQYSIDTLQSIYLQSFVRNQIRIEK